MTFSAQASPLLGCRHFGRQDLLDSIRDTEKAIADIDVVSRQKFAEAFERINENFREAFQTLFGGGWAGLIILGLENA